MTFDPHGYYADLGVSPTASTDEIKSVYRALAKIYHPDVNKDRAGAEKFVRITKAYETLRDPVRRAAYDEGGTTSSSDEAPQSSPPPRREKVEPITCSDCGKITAQPRYRTYRQVVGFLLATNTTSRSAIYCSDCAGRQALRSSAISACFGWWGLPIGPVMTIVHIFSNAFGGKRHKDIDEKLLWQNTIAFIDEGKYDLAGSLATQLVKASNTDIALGAKQLLGVLAAQGQTVAPLRSPWSFRPLSALAQVLMASAIPLAAYVLFADPFGLVATVRGPQAVATHVTRPPPAPVQPVNLCYARPINNQMLNLNLRRAANGHKLTIRNGASGDAIVKVRDGYTNAVAVSFYVKQNMSASFHGLPDGDYLVQFAYGEAMTADCRSFIDPSASEFEGYKSLRTTRTSTQIITRELSFTLYSVPDGNVRPRGINAADFNAD